METDTKEEKRNIMANMLETMMKATVKNNFYRWDGTTRQQIVGAAMDLRAYISLSRITMDDWI